jgi:hypothetical protein
MTRVSTARAALRRTANGTSKRKQYVQAEQYESYLFCVRAWKVQQTLQR